MKNTAITTASLALQIKLHGVDRRKAKRLASAVTDARYPFSVAEGWSLHEWCEEVRSYVTVGGISWLTPKAIVRIGNVKRLKAAMRCL